MPDTHTVRFYARQDLRVDGQTVPKGEAVCTIEHRGDVPIERVIAGLRNGTLTTEAPAAPPTPGQDNPDDGD